MVTFCLTKYAEVIANTQTKMPCFQKLLMDGNGEPGDCIVMGVWFVAALLRGWQYTCASADDEVGFVI